jgi:hypothetical protein
LIQEHHICITRFQANASTCSFYDEAGEVDPDRLESILPAHHDPVIGWFVSSSSRRLLKFSMRESAVTHSLTQHLNKDMLALFLGQAEFHNGATQVKEHR